jgi:hypothetical protein
MNSQGLSAEPEMYIKDQLKEIKILFKIGQREIYPKAPPDFYIQTAVPMGGGIWI